MNIAIIGFAREGKISYEYWKDGNSITICDHNPHLVVPDGVNTQLGETYLSNLERFDLVVRTPHLHPQAIIAANSVAIIPKITTSTNEFMRVCPTRNIICVTGTKGKGTTSTLITSMLRAAGKAVHLGGNIGVPALELLKENIQPDDYVVLETSSFQLIDLQQSPHTAVCLMVVPEHLDWHTDLEEYYAAKQQLFRWQTSDDIAIYYPLNENSVAIAGAGEGQKVPYMQSPGAEVIDDTITIDGHSICHTTELTLLGKHNWQNVCAALTAVWTVTQDVAALREALTTFPSLEHRLELVREVNGVRYYDDSFGTTPETAIVAIEAFDEPKVIILGGSDKGASYDELARVVATADIRKVLLIGQQAERIQAALEAANFYNFRTGCQTMTEIVSNAREEARSGDVVLLSTGCASFGMFADYKDRGNQFKTVVQSLE